MDRKETETIKSQEIIRDQAEQIAELREKNEELKEERDKCISTIDEIGSRLTMIGGPLNDSPLNYSEEQRKPLEKINELCMETLQDVKE